MMTRTTRTVIRFSSPFVLPGFELAQPPGDYRVDTDEELLGDTSRIAWRRVRSFIHLPAIPTRGSTQQMVPVVPAELDAALQKDNQQ